MKVSCPHCSQHIALIALLSLCDPLAQAQELSAPPAASASAQMEAVKKYPPLGVAGSAFNREFLARTQRARAETPGLFDDPAWPLALADELAIGLNALSIIGKSAISSGMPRRSSSVTI